MRQLSFHSPIGEITISEEDCFLVSIDWGWGQDQQETRLLIEARDQLIEYFDGARKTFDLPLHLAGTPFQKTVWNAMQSIPYGQVLTYGQVAKKLALRPALLVWPMGQTPFQLLFPATE